MYKLSKFLIKAAEFPKLPEFRTTTMNYSTDGNLAAETSMLNGGTLAQQIGAKDGSEVGRWLGSAIALPVIRKEWMDLGDMLETAIRNKDDAVIAEIKRNTKNVLDGIDAKTTTGKVMGALTRKKLGHMILAGKILPAPIVKSLLRVGAAGVGGAGLGYALGGLAGHYLYKD